MYFLSWKFFFLSTHNSPHLCLAATDEHNFGLPLLAYSTAMLDLLLTSAGRDLTRRTPSQRASMPIYERDGSRSPADGDRPIPRVGIFAEPGAGRRRRHSFSRSTALLAFGLVPQDLYSPASAGGQVMHTQFALNSAY
ncbi:hypothetical protein F4777DRAFT_16301 [Nemania sp. FL0916]|nr:hypothetical protein F4777DRAFT_16301 [Nemania sp. FL0916]